MCHHVGFELKIHIQNWYKIPARVQVEDRPSEEGLMEDKGGKGMTLTDCFHQL